MAAEFRIETDTMGEMKVPAERLWGAQTSARSRTSRSVKTGCRSS